MSNRLAFLTFFLKEREKNKNGNYKNYFIDVLGHCLLSNNNNTNNITITPTTTTTTATTTTDSYSDGTVYGGFFFKYIKKLKVKKKVKKTFLNF